MPFNSVAFALFLLMVFTLYWSFPHKYRWLLLLVTSYYFYMCWNPKYVVLILLTTIVSWIAALLIEQKQEYKKLILSISLCVCIGILFVFKYFNFFMESISNVLSVFTISFSPLTLNLLLPIGISFYTFQTLSYVIDVYKGNVKAEKNLGIYATFIAFFPQLVAGPIERTDNLLPQIKSEKVFNYDKAAYGLKLMVWGFFKKLAIADILGKYVDAFYGSLGTVVGFFDVAVAIFFFTIQIYCDFSGYSDIAIGTAKLLGIDLRTNFKSPYFSLSIKEFWSRWHISLSTWFKDYIYIPLGGNRCSKIKRDRNLLITFLISGLWHGANWTYVVWGGMHGIMQVLENHIRGGTAKKPRIFLFLNWMVVFAFCNIMWVFFRAETFSDAWYVLSALVYSLVHPALPCYNPMGLGKIDLFCIIFSISILAAYDFAALKIDVIEWVSKRNLVIRWICYLIFVWLILCFMLPSGSSQFVYFQF